MPRIIEYFESNQKGTEIMKWINKYFQLMKEWTNNLLTIWINKWIRCKQVLWLNKWMKGIIVNIYCLMSEWKSEWMSEWMSKWIDEW